MMARHDPTPHIDAPQLRAIDPSLSSFIDALPDTIAVLDEDCRIIIVNKAWKDFASSNGYSHPSGGLGESYLQVCEGASLRDPEVRPIVASLKAIRGGDRQIHRHYYNLPVGEVGRLYEVTFAGFWLLDKRLITVAHRDVTDELDFGSSNEAWREQLVDARENERRRIARELHDSTLQHLVGIRLLLSQLSHENGAPIGETALSEIDEEITQALREIRSFTFLLHPPNLRDHGLEKSLEILAKGFASRAGIAMSFRSEVDILDIPEPVQVAIFRITQEALSNIYRHSRATRASVVLQVRKNDASLVISDDGRGISREALDSANGGVGISGMRARARELGGTVTFPETPAGTTIEANFPLRSRSALPWGKRGASFVKSHLRSWNERR